MELINLMWNWQLAKAFRLKVHYTKCSVVHQLPEAELIPDRPIVRKRERSPSPPPAKRQAHSMLIIAAQQQMNTHIVKTSTNYKNTINLEVAKLFYACNIPFNVAKHSQFKKLTDDYALHLKINTSGSFSPCFCHFSPWQRRNTFRPGRKSIDFILKSGYPNILKVLFNI